MPKKGELRTKSVVYLLAMLFVGIILVLSQGQLGLPSQSVLSCNARQYEDENGNMHYAETLDEHAANAQKYLH